MKREFMVNRSGRDFVLYTGLLDQAHQEGLKRITTELIQAPTPENGQTAICRAEVETAKGVFSGIGDANPQNVGRQIAPHSIRMAETRAKARALRDAINVAVAAVEELGDDDEPAPAPVRPAARPTPQPAPAPAERVEPSRAHLELQSALLAAAQARTLPMVGAQAGSDAAGYDAAIGAVLTVLLGAIRHEATAPISEATATRVRGALLWLSRVGVRLPATPDTGAEEQGRWFADTVAEVREAVKPAAATK